VGFGGQWSYPGRTARVNFKRWQKPRRAIVSGSGTEVWGAFPLSRYRGNAGVSRPLVLMRLSASPARINTILIPEWLFRPRRRIICGSLSPIQDNLHRCDHLRLTTSLLAARPILIYRAMLKVTQLLQVTGNCVPRHARLQVMGRVCHQKWDSCLPRHLRFRARTTPDAARSSHGSSFPGSRPVRSFVAGGRRRRRLRL
jgi:hypothetical protein